MSDYPYPAMRLRTATTRDLHRLTEITTTSLIDDPTYDYLYPHRRRFPEDNWTWMRLRLESLLYNKRATLLVCEIDQDCDVNKGYAEKQDDLDQACSIIISYGIWIRMGHDKAAKERMAHKNTWSNMLDGLITQVCEWSLNQKYSRRDFDTARFLKKGEVSEQMKREFFSESPNWWSLELLVTDRNYRRRGAATQIVTWGTTAADFECVPCGVEASPMGAPLYQALGFMKLTTWTVKVPGDEGSLDEDVMKRCPKSESYE